MLAVARCSAVEWRAAGPRGILVDQAMGARRRRGWVEVVMPLPQMSCSAVEGRAAAGGRRVRLGALGSSRWVGCC